MLSIMYDFPTYRAIVFMIMVVAVGGECKVDGCMLFDVVRRWRCGLLVPNLVEQEHEGWIL